MVADAIKRRDHISYGPQGERISIVPLAHPDGRGMDDELGEFETGRQLGSSAKINRGVLHKGGTSLVE